MYDVVERFGSSKIAFVIETKKPKKKIVGKKYGKHVENNSMGKSVETLWKKTRWKKYGKNVEMNSKGKVCKKIWKKCGDE